MLQAIQFQDAYLSSIKSRALTVGNILIDIDQVTEEGLRDCVSVLLSTVETAPELSCSPAALPLLMDAYSSVISKGTNLSMSMLSDIEDSMERLAVGCQNSMAIGEDPVTMMTDMILFLSTKADKSGLQGKQFQLPQSAFDSFEGGSTSSIELDGSSFGPSDYVGLSVSQYLNNPGKRASSEDKSAPIQLTTQSSSNFSFQISLLNIDSVQYSLYNISSTSGSVRCDREESSPYEVTVDCSHGRSSTVTCPAKSTGAVSFTCPGRALVPYCTVLMDGSYIELPSCEVVYYDDHSTTCKCASSALTRRLLTSSSKSFSTSIREADIGKIVIIKKFDQSSSTVLITTFLLGVLGLYFVGAFALTIRSLISTANELSVAKKSSGGAYRSIHRFYEDIFPSTLRAGAWHYVWGSRLVQEHLLVNVVSSMVSAITPRSSVVTSLAKWTLVMAKWVVYLFVNCVVTKLMYADDGFCGDQSTQSSCNSATTTGNYFRACEWHSDGGYCAFHKPVKTFGTIMLLVLLVTCFSSPTYQLMCFCMHRVTDFCERHFSARRIASEFSNATSLEPGNDEFRIVQHFRATLFRAARLEKIRNTVDNIRSQEEERSIVHSIEEEESRDALISDKSTRKLLHLLYLKQQKGPLKSSAYILDEIERSRNAVAYLSRAATSMETAEQQEEYLMSSFVVDSFYGCKRRIAARHFLERFDTTKTRSNQSAMAPIEFLSIGLFVAMTAIMIYFIVYFSSDIGSRSTDLWLIISLVSFFEDLIILQPLIIWINWAMIDVPVARDARELVNYLSMRSRFIMMRTAGQMREAGSLVQHFNSACRAARMFPALPVSRLLFSLNDSDVPLHKPFNYLYVLTQMTAYLPRDVQAVVLNIFVAFVLNLLAVLFYDFGLVSAPAAYAVFAALIVGCIFIAFLSYHPDDPKPPSGSDMSDWLPFQLQADDRKYLKVNSFKPLLSLAAADQSNSKQLGCGIIFDQKDDGGLVTEKEQRQVSFNDIQLKEVDGGADTRVAMHADEAADEVPATIVSAIEPPAGGDAYEGAKSAFESQMHEIYSKVGRTVDIQQPPSQLNSPNPSLSELTYHSGLSMVDVRAILDSSAGAAHQKPLHLKKEAARVVSTTQQEQDD